MFAGGSVRSIVYPAASEAIQYGISRTRRDYRSRHEAVPEAYFVRQVYVNNYERNDEDIYTYLVEAKKVEAARKELHTFLGMLNLCRSSFTDKESYPLFCSKILRKHLIYHAFIDTHTPLTDETICIALAGISTDDKFASSVINYALCALEHAFKAQ